MVKLYETQDWQTWAGLTLIYADANAKLACFVLIRSPLTSVAACQQFARPWSCCAAPRSVEYSLRTQEHAGVSFKQISSASIFLFHSELWSEGRQSAVQRGRRHLRNLSGWFQRPRTPPLSGESLVSTWKIIEETVTSFPTVIAKKIGTKKKGNSVLRPS